MSETMRRQIRDEARAARGKLPPVAGVACARPAGFPTAAALCPGTAVTPSSDVTEAREAHAEGGIPEGGNSPAPDVQPHEPGLFPAEPVFPESCRACGVYEAPGVQAAIRDVRRAVRRAASEAHYQLVLSASQMKLVKLAVSCAIDEAIDAMREEPDGRHEIQPSLDAYNGIYRALEAAKAANKSTAAGDFGSMRGGAR